MKTDSESVAVVVYRCARRADTYVYMRKEDDFEDLPDAFRAQFPDPTPFLDFELHPTRPLAQADPVAVLRALSEQGFYLQLPPQKDEL